MATPEVPIWALVHLTHAALQRTADRADVDVLHIKGPATRSSLRTGRHDSSDTDVLVRPAHLDRFLAALAADGWTLFTGFEEGSPFGHAANYTHPSWTYADVHRKLPGPLLDADEVFDVLWRDREHAEIGHCRCTVPSLAGQVVVQTLHAARSHGSEHADAWDLSAPEVQDDARALARELKAETPLAAAIGELDAHRDAPDHALWEYWSSSESDRLDEWAARYRSAAGVAERWRVLRQAMHVNRTHLRIRLGHEPTPFEVFREQCARIAHGAVSVLRRARGHRA